MQQLSLPKEKVKSYLAPFAWHHGDLSWKLDSLQLKIRNTVLERADAKKILLLCSRQIGKSFWASSFAIEYLANNPGKIARILAPTLKQCGDIVQDNLNPICRDAPLGFITPRKSEYRWELANGSSLRLGTLERAHVDNNRGGNASLVIYEECGFVSRDEFIYGVNSVIGPQLLRSNGREIFVSSPSEDPDHPMHTIILPECEASGTLFQYEVFDSPSITEQMIEEAARRCGGYDSDAFMREYRARIIRPTTLMVIPAYDPSKHVKPYRAPDQCNWHVTIDWGGVRDLTVALLHTYEFMNDIDMVWDEMMWPANTSTDKIHEDLMRWEHDYYIHSRWGDMPGQVQVDLSNQFDYQINMPQKSDWKASVNNMAVRFSTDKILIHPRCTFLQKSCRAGMFNKNRTDFDRNTDLGHCDGLAALMYAIRSQDRSNPYTPESGRNDNVFFTTKPSTEIQDLGEALNPKRFGRFR